MSGKDDFIDLLRQALQSEQLQAALKRFVSAYRAQRARAMADIDFASVQEALREIKEKAVEALPRLIETFREQAEKAGAQVFLAETKEEANHYVAALAERRGVRLAVKAKSMLTEELSLNRFLEEKGVRVVETDLGEWILQLAGERPSHFTAPAIHKTREDVAALFRERFGEEIPDDIPGLVKVARKKLRSLFFEADLGITGANIAIAESGTLVMVTNEGNGRLVSTLPPAHVAVVGVEKLVPAAEDALRILKILARNATGQILTSYTTFITGPSRTADIEKSLTIGVHGPEALHIVLVDNGRMRLRDDPDFRELLYCIKCGACLNTCPAYGVLGGHYFGGSTYAGGIGTLLEYRSESGQIGPEQLKLCSGCLTCRSFCPVRIDTPGMVRKLTAGEVRKRGLPMLQRLPLGILRHPGLFHEALRTAAALQRLVNPRGRDYSSLPGPLSDLTRFRTVPPLKFRTFRERVPGLLRDGPVKPLRDMTVAFYPGCMVEHCYPEIGEAVVRVLHKLGVRVIYPEGQGCCGIPALQTGDRNTAWELAAWNIRLLSSAAADFIVTACPTCSGALTHEFGELAAVYGKTEEGENMAEAARRIAEKTRDFSTFIVRELGLEALAGRLKQEAGERGTYHESCHLRSGMGVTREPRALLRAAGVALEEMEAPEACCGFAGSYSLTYPDISAAILEKKLLSIRETETETVFMDCPGCLLQIAGGLKKQGSPVKAVHTAVLIDGLL
jgi:iron-sulfur cluster protein